MQGKTSPWSPETFATALAYLRAYLHVNQQSLADWAEVGAPQISRWKSGTSRPGYDALRQLLSRAIQNAPEGDDGRAQELAHRVAEAAGYPNMPLGGADELMVSPYSGQVWRIVRSLEKRAEDAGLTEAEERAMIERAMENAERQAEMMFDADLARRERDQEPEG